MGRHFDVMAHLTRSRPSGWSRLWRNPGLSPPHQRAVGLSKLARQPSNEYNAHRNLSRRRRGVKRGGPPRARLSIDRGMVGYALKPRFGTVQSNIGSAAHDVGSLHVGFTVAAVGEDPLFCIGNALRIAQQFLDVPEAKRMSKF